MSAAFGLTVIFYSVGIAVVCATCAVTARPRPRPVLPALAILQLSVLAQATVDAVAVARGQHGDGLAVHLGYLATSLVVLPVVAAAIRLDPGRWGSTGLAFGCLLLAVVSLRLHQTLGHAHA